MLFEYLETLPEQTIQIGALIVFGIAFLSVLIMFEVNLIRGIKNKEETWLADRDCITNMDFGSFLFFNILILCIAGVLGFLIPVFGLLAISILLVIMSFIGINVITILYVIGIIGAIVLIKWFVWKYIIGGKER